MLILASASQARKSLIERLSIDYRVIVSQIDEQKFQHPNIKGLVQKLSIAKAEFVDSRFLLKDIDEEFSNRASAILGCDSLFKFNGYVYGKPKTKKNAIERWKMMSGNSGFLHTGHCLMYKSNLKFSFRERFFKGIYSDVISTKINFSNLSDTEIVNYVETEEPINCAGGFAIDGKGAAFIESINGCATNVMGLSLPWLRQALKKALIPLQI